jgi:predicted O-methyltransferase YrrM
MIDITRALAIDGWMSPEELTWLAEQARECSVIIEVGSHLGRSTAALADHCPGHVFAVDKWADASVFAAFMEKKCRNVLKMVGTSPEIANAFAPELCVDLVFIDADHSYEAVKADIAAWRRFVKPGGILAGHDHDGGWPGVEKAVDEAFGGRFAEGPGSIWWVRL